MLDGRDGPTLGMPRPDENQGMGDLILFAKNGYAFKGDAGGDAAAAISQGYLGTHGYPASDPEIDGIFIAQGNRYQTRRRAAGVANLDVAPTIPVSRPANSERRRSRVDGDLAVEIAGQRGVRRSSTIESGRTMILRKSLFLWAGMGIALAGMTAGHAEFPAMARPAGWTFPPH